MFHFIFVDCFAIVFSNIVVAVVLIAIVMPFESKFLRYVSNFLRSIGLTVYKATEA